MALVACGGGGTSVAANTFSGTWSGVGSWQQYSAGGSPLGTNVTGVPTSGTINSVGDIDLKMQFGAGSSNIYDQMLGSTTNGGTASGIYWDAKNQDGSGGNQNTYTATFSLVGNTLTVVYIEAYGSGTVRGAYTLSRI
jgi:hypothetical protein